MAGHLNKDHAKSIARKLHATIYDNGAHDLAVVEYKGVEIVSFGIRKGSAKELGHGHLPEDLHINQYQCRKMAECFITERAYIQILIEKGIIEEDQP
jgi:hypothetical protein